MNTARELEDRYAAPLVDEGVRAEVARLATSLNHDPSAMRVVAERRRGTVAGLVRVWDGVVPRPDLKLLLDVEGHLDGRPLSENDPALMEMAAEGLNVLLEGSDALPDVLEVLRRVSQRVRSGIFVSPANELGGQSLGEIDAMVSPWRREEGASVRADRGLMEDLRRVAAETEISALVRRRMMATLLHSDPSSMLKFMLYHLSSAEDPEVLAVAALARALKRKGLEAIDFAAFLEVMEWLARNKERGAVRVESGTMLERGLKIMSRLGYMIVKPAGAGLYDLAVNSALLSTTIKNPELMVLMRGMLEEFSG